MGNYAPRGMAVIALRGNLHRRNRTRLIDPLPFSMPRKFRRWNFQGIEGLIPFLNHYEIRRTDDDSASSTARKGQQHIVMI